MNSKNYFLLFDMDGVLIDVEGSYREVVRQTVLIYLKNVLGFIFKDETWLTLKNIDAIKKSGGLNNDWDLTYTILNTILIKFFDRNNKVLLNSLKNAKSNEEDILKIIDSFKLHFNKIKIEDFLHRFNLIDAYKEVKTTGQISIFLFNDGDVGSGNIVKRIFQEVYLGKEVFKEIYGLAPLFYSKEKGLIENERLIPEKSIIKDLSRKNILGIATGRPAVEAIYALKRFELETFFKVVVTEDDILKAEKANGELFRKPHPFIIQECIRRVGWKDKKKVYYIGDMPDDIEASIRAGVNPIGFVYAQGKAENEILKHIGILKEKGAKRTITDFALLNDFV